MSPEKKPAKRFIGYARVSTEQQDLARQLIALRAHPCDVIYSEKASGKSIARRPELTRALATLLPGDTFVIAEWNRATRSMWDGLEIIKQVLDAQASILVLDRSYFDLRTPMGQGVLALLSAMAEDDRLRIIERTHEGRQLARAKGVRMGRKPILTPHQQDEARERFAKGEPTRQLAKSYGVSVSTIGRLLAGYPALQLFIPARNRRAAEEAAPPWACRFARVNGGFIAFASEEALQRWNELARAVA